MGPAAGAVIEIISDDEKEDSFSAKPTADALDWASSLLLDDLTGLGEGLDDSAVIQELLSALEGEKKAAADDDDDDCVILDSDPDKPLIVVKEEKPGKDGAEEDLQVLSEKGEVACRDFPHPRHLCARLPFGSGSHANHCTMCHCYVCDSRAPCPMWGKGTLPTDHCHATDKDEKWKKQRQSLKRKSVLPSKREGVKKMSLPSSTTPSSQQFTGHQVSAAQPYPYAPLWTTVNYPLSQNQQRRPSALGTGVNQPVAGRVPVASNVSPNQQLHPSALRATVNQPSTGRVPVASNVSRNQQLHPSALGTNVNKPSTARLPVASNASQNQQMHPSVMAAQNAWRTTHLPKASAPGPKFSGKTSNRPGAAPTVYTPSNGYIYPALRNNAPMHPATTRAVQTVQAAPGSRGLPGGNLIQGFSTQRSLAAPVQVRPMPHLQAAPNGSSGTAGMQQLRQCSTRVAQATQQVTQATQGAQDASAIQKSWQIALANLASDLGVSDYNVERPPVQPSVSTQPLHQSQLLAQPKAVQGPRTHCSSIQATADTRPSNGLPQHDSKPADGAVSMQKTQALCILNSQSSLTSSETSLNSLVAKPAMEH
ncbi:hypothetical protein CFC21_059378 [Triticum aestivum]|uniref:Uncharacterized protein n=3 Tax=Triticum aestivum TaxID=4565 RepID=A0A3B6IZA5_WHEAT|nr:uncharacterized protein LOC123093746 isoform X1 [Triticum aestivum]XP_044371725.1 uncharacterized protein LOC123093746 isoform X1 [Triticum aestivum]KAF7051099.1 hypothetical protein CFC21_059378 [Triticum aestivum]